METLRNQSTAKRFGDQKIAFLKIKANRLCHDLAKKIIHDYKPELLFSKHRGYEYMLVKYVVIYYLYHVYKLKQEEIALLFDRDRTTILHSIQTLSGWLDSKDPNAIFAYSTFVNMVNPKKISDTTLIQLPIAKDFNQIPDYEPFRPKR